MTLDGVVQIGVTPIDSPANAPTALWALVGFIPPKGSAGGIIPALLAEGVV